MAFAEAQARLNVNLREIVTFFEESGIEPHSAALMNEFIDKHLTTDFLIMAEGFGKCMAFIDHDELVAKLLKSYLSLIDGYLIERKNVNKRLKNLKEDKKSDPEVIARLENVIIEIDNKKAIAMTSTMRLRVMNYIPLSNFKDEKFDAMPFYKNLNEKQKALSKAGLRK